VPAAIRGYEASDLEACRALWIELTDWHRSLYDRPEIGGADPARAFDAHLERVGPENLWVAEADGVVAGLVGLIVDGERGELEPVIVDERHRRQGIGGRLVETVLQAARRRGVRQLRTRPVARNAAAIAFFHAAGFDVLGHVELLRDVVPRAHGDWREGERLAELPFRV
jgi:GNAT superfamily N-acetyltransferase